MSWTIWFDPKKIVFEYILVPPTYINPRSATDLTYIIAYIGKDYGLMIKLLATQPLYVACVVDQVAIEKMNVWVVKNWWVDEDYWARTYSGFTCKRPSTASCNNFLRIKPSITGIFFFQVVNELYWKSY